MHVLLQPSLPSLYFFYVYNSLVGHDRLSWATELGHGPNVHTSPLLKCNLVCICLHVACFSIWVAHHFTQNWNATSQFFFATDPSNQKWSLIDCKTALRTSCFSPGLSADPTPPVTLCSSSSVTCQSIRTKCLCDGRRQSVSKQGEKNGREKTG